MMGKLRPTKRQVLEAIHRDDLIDFVEHFGLEVADRRRKDGLVEALAASKKARLADMLAMLRRDQLQGLCRELGLDDGGDRAELSATLGGAKPSRTEPETLRAPAQPVAAPAPARSPSVPAPSSQRGKPARNGEKKNGGTTTTSPSWTA